VYAHLILAVPQLKLSRAGPGLVAGAHESDEAGAVEHLNVAHSLADLIVVAQLPAPTQDIIGNESKLPKQNIIINQ
jgi:hypothetical protein